MAGVAIVVFSDLVDSTALLARLGDDRMDELRRAHVTDVASVVQAAGGRLIKTLGDGAMASFDSALGALDAAAGIQVSVERLDAARGGIGIAARVGVAAGEPISDGEDLHGMAVVIASRLCSAAGSGEVLVQDLVVGLVASRDVASLKDVESYQLKGVPEPVRAASLDWRDLAATDRIGPGARVAERDGGGSASALDGSGNGALGTADRVESAMAPQLDLDDEAGEFLERDSDLLVLEESLAAVRLGSDGRLVLIGGEAGVGKTALLRRFCNGQHGSARILWGACEPLLTPRPFGPLLDIAEATSGELAELVAGEGRPHQVAPALIRELARRQPTVVVFEDVHWADEATLDVLTLLGRRIEAVPALVLVSFRDDELEGAERLRVVLGGLSGKRIGRLELTPLSAVAVLALAQPNGVDGNALYRSTGGNPFFVTEVLAGGSGDIPRTVSDAVLGRAARLSVAARRLLEAVAIVPGQAEVSLLEVLADDLVDHLDECLAAGVLTSRPGYVGFRHELARLAVEEAVAPNRRVALHRRTLATIAGRREGGADFARLAHHAEEAGDTEAVLRYAPQAAERAASSSAHREAAAQWARALRFADGLPAERLAPMYERRSYECCLTGELQEALGACERAIELWRRVGDLQHEGDCLRWLSRLWWNFGERQQADRYAAEAVVLLETLPPSRELAMAYSNRAALAMLAAQTAETVAWGGRAIELAERLGDRETLAGALNNVGTAQLLSGAEDGRAALERSLAVSLEDGLEDYVVRAFTNLAASLAMTKEPVPAEHYLEQALSYCAEHELDEPELHALGWLAMARLDSGRWNEATDAAEKVLRAAANPIPRVDALVALGRVRARRGDPDVRGPLDEALTLAVPTGEQRLARVAAARAEAAWLAGTGDVALETERANRVARDVGNPWEIGELACWRWRVGSDQEIPARVAEPYALQMAGEWARAAELWRRRSCRYEAALALGDGDDEDALRQALAELQRMGARPAAAIVARKLRKRGVRGLPRGSRPGTRENPAGLTAREVEVLALLSDGLPNAQIAERLVISQKTVDHHVSAILRKLDAGTRGEAVATAMRLGLVGQDR